MAELTRKPLGHSGSLSRATTESSQSSPNVSYRGDQINRSLGLLEQAVGVGRSPRTPLLPPRTGPVPATPQGKGMDYTLSTPTMPVRKSNLNESRNFMSPTQSKMLFTPSEMLSVSLLETSRNLPRQSLLTMPTAYPQGRSLALIEQSPMATPGRNATMPEHVNLLVENDPGVTATEGLYEDFYQSFKTHQSPTEVFHLIRRYEEVCKEQILLLNELTKRVIPGEHKFVKTKEVLEQLQRERCTWRLMDSLYTDRLASMEDMEDGGLNSESRPFDSSEKDISNQLFNSKSDVRQAQIIVDWLERCASDQADFDKEKVEYYSQSVCWENSLHNLQQRAGGIASIPKNHVTSLDPDAAVRENKNLSDLDKEDEVRLLRDVFLCIRTGRLEEAQRLCKKCSQSWRAATLEGWRLYHDPNIRNDVNQGRDPVEGNPFRDVWKKVCWQMSEDERYHQYERAMYAALSGNLRQLQPVLVTWPDYLWAYFKVMVDQKVEQAVRDKLTNLSRPMEQLPPNYDQKQLTVQNIFHEMQAIPDKKVENDAKEKHYIVQKYVILDDLDTLTEEMVEWISSSTERPGRHTLRFMAHFILVIRSLGLQTREEASIQIIEEYVKDLIEAKQTEMVAVYVAQLPPSLQVAYYAKFLEGISEQDYQQRCLQLAGEAGLDVAAITKTVVENIRTGSDSALTDVISTNSLESATSEDDQKKIEAINWLVFHKSQRAEAIKQSNALIRTFLEMKKHDAARDVFQKIPQDSVADIICNWRTSAGNQPLPAEDANAIKEHLCIKAYLDALSAFNDWFDHCHNKKPVPPTRSGTASFHERVRLEHEDREFEMELEKWEQSSLAMTKSVSDTIYNVLLFVDGGWMYDMTPVEDDDLREGQMVRLREMCIPLLCTLLLQVLHTAGLYRECLTLADVIASEEQQLYKVFKSDDLKQLLLKLRDSSSCLLDQNLDALGYEL